MDYAHAPMLTLLRDEAERRGLIAPDGALSPARVFSLIRDMPYQRASTRAASAILQEWRGTCSGKHYLLDALYREMGYATQVVMCPHRFTRQNTAHFPDALRSLVDEAPIPDVHTFVRIWTDDHWMDVDATWPTSAGRLGMPVNSRFELGVDMPVACDALGYFVVPHGVDPQSFKEELITTHCEGRGAQRDAFIEGMSRWLTEGAGA